MEVEDIKKIDISEINKTYSIKEIEHSEYFAKVMEQSENDYKNGKTQELTDELLNEIFNTIQNTPSEA
ncbi:hypothetical protein [Chryseobacterium hispalense]|uniref:hypothetical protein n=1 Tax=Chryseobacterium hispalense TaxID=1453492 RepID=UPI0004936E1A|nr:hypothetical protein [Chryseobacterium hispalense]